MNPHGFPIDTTRKITTLHFVTRLKIMAKNMIRLMAFISYDKKVKSNGH